MTDTQRTVEAFYAAFGANDATSMTALLAPDVVWSVGGAPRIPWAGTVRGVTEALALARRWTAAVTVLGGERQPPICDGDRAVVCGTGTIRVNATDCVFEDRWVHVWRVRDGRIIAFDEYGDTAAAIAAL